MQRLPGEDLQHVLTHTATLWEQVRNKSIFLTGGTGFFGKWLAESFLYINNALQLDAKLTILSRNPDAFINQFPFYSSEPSVDFIKGDVLNFEFPRGRNFDFVIHAATDADAKLNEESPLLMLDTNTLGTRRVLDFARLQQLEGFLLTSSGAVYGKQPEAVTHAKETDAFFIDINNASSAYAEGKRVSELYCSIYNKQFGLPVKIARCYAFVGPYLPLNKHFAIGNFILNGLNTEDIIIKGDGTPHRSYMYASDLAIWLWTILLKGQNNVGYNVGSDHSVSIEETAELVAKGFNNSIEYKILGKKTGQPIHRYVPDITKAKSELGVSITVDINDAISRTKDFYIKA